MIIVGIPNTLSYKVPTTLLMNTLCLHPFRNLPVSTLKSTSLLLRTATCPQFNSLSNKRQLSLKLNFSRFKLNPPHPGGVLGDINNPPYKSPEYDSFHGSYHWQYQQVVTVTLLPLTGYSLYAGLTDTYLHPLIDTGLCSTLLMYVYFELVSCITDYIPKRKFGIWNRIAKYLLGSGTALGFYGIYELETSDSGLVELLKRIWKKDYNVEEF